MLDEKVVAKVCLAHARAVDNCEGADPCVAQRSVGHQCQRKKPLAGADPALAAAAFERRDTTTHAVLYP
eukprot:scaffold187784_cov30-Tisochrysis_lutea.AAC.3